MTQWKSLAASTAMVLVLTSAASADVTGAEVWDNWKSVSESMGQTLTPGSETQDGNTLTVSDVVVSMDVPDMTMMGTIDEIVFVDQGDGTVAITVSPSYDMTMAMAPEEGEKINIAMRIDQPDMAMTASGGDGTVLYEFSGPTLSLEVTEFVANGEPMELGLMITAVQIGGSYEVTEAEEMDTISSELTASSVMFVVDAKEPGGDGTAKVNVDMADVSMLSDGNMGMMASFEDLPAMLAAGFASAGELSHGAATYDVDFQDGRDTFQLQGSASGGGVYYALDSDSVSYDVGTTELAISMAGSEIPLPEVAFDLAEFGFGFLMPLAQTEDPQDFGLKLILADLNLSDMIWGLADPTGAIPHDPATLAVDVTGQANWLVDIMDPESADLMGESIPAELHTLDLNDLTLAVGGAILTGMGGFTFDNDNLETFDGLPAPTGEIDLKLVGGNALLDTLVAMGLVPEDQAMGARMMMGLFARPGDGEDTLVSKIEVDGATGAISANGQRLQ